MAAKKRPAAAPAATTRWRRVSKGGAHSEFDPTRTVDAAEVAKLLAQRDRHRAEREYTLADAAAAKLVKLDICYNDDSREWYPRKIGSGRGVDGKATSKKTHGAAAPVDGKKRQRLKLLRRKKKRRKQEDSRDKTQ